VHRQGPGFNDLILHNDNVTDHKTISVKQFLAQKLINEMEQPCYSPDLVLNDLWLFPKRKSALKGGRFKDTEVQKEM
jgi:hypothetical protein